MKKLTLLILLIIPTALQAQTKHKITLTLQQAIQLGLENRYDLKAKHYNIKLAKNKIQQQKKDWIPNIQASGRIQYNTQIRATYVPGGFAGFNKPRTLAFGAKNETSFGLSLTQTLFKPGITTDVKIANARLALQKEKLRGNRIEVKMDIAKAYLEVLLKKLQYQIAKDKENRFQKYKSLVKGKYSHGAVIKNVYLQAKLNYKNAKIKTAIMRQNYKLSLAYLKYQMNIPSQTQLILSDSIGHISFDYPMLQQGNFVNRRSKIKQLKLRKQKNALQIKRARQNMLPTVSLFGYYGQTYQNKNFHYGESKWWAPHSYLGLKFSIPITGFFSNKNKIQKQKLQQQQLAMKLRQKRSTIHYQIRKATINLKNARKNMQAAKRNYKLAQSIYRNQQKQFAIGSFKYSELLDTEESLENAEKRYVQAVYHYLIAQIEYKKAIGW